MVVWRCVNRLCCRPWSVEFNVLDLSTSTNVVRLSTFLLVLISSLLSMWVGLFDLTSALQQNKLNSAPIQTRPLL